MTARSPLQDGRNPDQYRANAGIALFSSKGLVFIGRRIGGSASHHWQMPQGGIDPGETPLCAAYRELEEETGIAKTHIRLLAEAESWYYYDFPPAVRRRLRGPYVGQRQKWFAFLFCGRQSDIVLDQHAPPEFDIWRWAGLDEISGLVVPFKRTVYEAIRTQFAGLTADVMTPRRPREPPAPSHESRNPHE